MAETEDGLGLSLSLSLSLRNSDGLNTSQPPPIAPPLAVNSFPLNLFRSPLPFMQQHKISTTDAFHRPYAEVRSSYHGIDVNRDVDLEEEVMASSPNSTVSSLSGKRSDDVREEHDGDFLEIEDDDNDGDAAARRKLRLSKEQAAVLEKTFTDHNTLNPSQKQKMELAKQLNLRPRQVEVWFQNRRARTKLKQTEVECEYLRRSCENLTEENRRLQKEVMELRALKLVSPQFYRNMSPPTTLTLCPQCQRVASR